VQAVLAGGGGGNECLQQVVAHAPVCTGGKKEEKEKEKEKETNYL